jgi:hypothetical protein
MLSSLFAPLPPAIFAGRRRQYIKYLRRREKAVIGH